MSGTFGLGADARSRLLGRLGGRRKDAPAPAAEAPAPPRPPLLGSPDRYEEIRVVKQAAELLRIEDPFFNSHDGIAGASTTVGGVTLHNFSSYNYVGLNGHPAVSAAARDAIDQFGTSVSASRIVSGERPLHRALEAELAALYRTEAAVTLVSGHATNVSAIGCLLEAGDLVVHDSFSHNSIVQGCILSGAQRVSFPHNDVAALDALLATARPRHRQCLVVVEGHYSMDGDVPDLAAIIPVVRRHRAALMVDEAHSLGVLGATGQGIAEHAGIDPAEVDLWMGTLSKTLSGCGGYLAGRAALIEYLKFSAPGFVYSVGLPPPMAAAALESLRLLRAEPERVARLNANATRFLEAARAAGLDTGPSIGAAIVPIILGSSIRAAKAAHALYERGINVQPIIHPAVPERAARLRFFISSEHTEAQIDETVALVAEVVRSLASDRISMAALKAQLALR